MVNRIVVFLLVALAASSQAAQAQVAQPVPDVMKLSGPRMGVTFLSDGIVRKLEEDIAGDFDGVGSVISQFGWQWEKRFYSGQSGVTAVTEWALLFGGMDQGIVIPSLSWMVGARTAKGIEFAVGPNFTPVGVALAFAAGVNFPVGHLNVPVNFAVVPSKAGVRVSMLAGFVFVKFAHDPIAEKRDAHSRSRQFHDVGNRCCRDLGLCRLRRSGECDEQENSDSIHHDQPPRASWRTAGRES